MFKPPALPLALHRLALGRQDVDIRTTVGVRIRKFQLTVSHTQEQTVIPADSSAR